ncbi:MAG: tyrosine--tRNA ligase [Flavobacteriales bacterium]|nr:tyrosine--tRNA ligase [Flavobacteriales bacterium]
MNLIDELKWRGLLHDMMPGIEEQLEKELTAGYVGFDPTADSLHIGNLVPIMLLVHLQRAGHKPIALVGGATGMVGDPSGKTAERQLLDVESINHNLACQRKQLEHFLDFDCGENSAEVVNNYDWFKDFTFLDFIRDVGKHITVNYMMAKDSVKKRLESGMSFTEFTYQLVQGYDFYYLWKHQGVKIQMGGSDQWGNIVTGTEMIRKKGAGEAFALTAPLITKADGSKFGKSEGGNVWLDAEKTSPYKFYQYWISASDEDASKYIRIFTLMSKEEIEAIEAEHAPNPGARVLQKALAEDVTRRIHGENGLQNALAATSLLFGKGTKEQLEGLSNNEILQVFSGIPHAEVSRSEVNDGLDIIEALGAKTNFLDSNGEARRALNEHSVKVNTEKVEMGKMISSTDLINDKFVVLQRGKKKFFLLSVAE